MVSRRTKVSGAPAKPVSVPGAERPKRASVTVWPPIWGLGFLMVAFLFVWKWVNPALIYHAQMPLFFTGKRFLAPFLESPGGILNYLAHFLGQIYQFPWAGALLTAAVLGLGIVANNACYRLVAGRPQPGLLGSVPVPVCVLLVSVTLFDYPWLVIAGGWLAAMAALLLYLKCSFRHVALRTSFFCILVMALTWCCGVIPGALFVLLGAGAEFVSGKRLCAAASLIVGVAILFGISSFYAIKVVELIGTWGVGYSKYLSAALYLICPATLIFNAVFKPKASAVETTERVWMRPAVRLLGECGLLLATIAAAALSVDQGRKAAIELDYYAQREQWPQVLQAASRLTAFDPASRVHINRALFHEGHLLDALFTTCQTQSFEILPGPEPSPDVWIALSATLFELGQVNLAEHWAHEALERDGESPYVLQLLAKINVAKNRPQAAKTFLGLLRKNPFYSQLAGEQIRRIAANPRWDGDPELERIRSLKVVTDNPTSGLTAGPILLQLLDTNPKNRMAFEYLMAHYLLSMKPENIVKNLAGCNDVGIREFPPLMEQAILAHRQLVFQETGQAPPINLQGRTISPATLQKVEQLKQILIASKNDMQAAQAPLASALGDSYWYYSMFCQTPPKPGWKSCEKKL